MGRIKTTAVKRLAKDLMMENGDAFTGEFGENKINLAKMQNIKSKKIRNIVAGYITKQTKRKKARA